LDATLSAAPLALMVPALKIGAKRISFKSRYEQIVEQLAFDDTKQRLCGEITIQLVTKHPFLQILPTG